MARPSIHDPITKSYAIDQIEDIEQLRAVAHRMWEAFHAAHNQTAHAICALHYGECDKCKRHIETHEGPGCERYWEWQAKVDAGFGVV